MLRLFKNSKHYKIFDDIAASKAGENKDKISISESFQKYITEIIPKYQVEIETSILRKLYHNMKNPLLQKHLLNVYRRRQLHLIYKAHHPDLSVIPIKPSPDVQQEVIDYFGKDISKVRYNEIGKMYTYSLAEFLHFFPRINYGHLYFVDKHMKYCHSFAFQMTPEAFSTIELLRAKESLRKIAFEKFKMPKLFQNAKNKSDLEIILSDKNLFYKLIFTLGENFREILVQRRFDAFFPQLFNNSFLVDYIILILIWNLDREDVRSLIFDSEKRQLACAKIIDEILNHKNVKYFVPYSIESWFENQIMMSLSENVQINLLELNGVHKKIPNSLRHYLLPNFIGINSNILFWGVHGAGKSGLLYAVTMWAIKSNWLVIKLPSVKAITWNETEYDLIRHEESRLWMSPVFSKSILEDMLNTNRDLFAQIPVKQELYGRYNIVAIHDQEENPVPNFYIEDRQTYFYEAEKTREPEEIEEIVREQEIYKFRLKEKLPNPKNLLEIAEFGMKEDIFCDNCIAEILEQVYNLDNHFALIAIDDFNWFYRPTNMPAFYYQNIKSLEGLVPPYHIALCRLFMKFDGHMIKNGFKIGGSSNFSIIRHYFEPSKINFPEEFCQKLNGMQMKDSENFLAYCADHSLDGEKNRNWEYYKSIWTETQGNYARMLHLLRYPEFRQLD